MKVTFRCLLELEGVVPEPRLARAALPNWFLEAADSAADDRTGDEVATFKQCPPFADAMGCGFHLPLACDVRVVDGRVSWSWKGFPPVSSQRVPRSPMSFQPAAAATGSPFPAGSMVLVRFMSFWTISLPADYSLLVTHPFNRDDLPYRTLTGLVTGDTCGDTYLHIPAMWTDRDYSGLLAQGTPVAQCIPVPTAVADIVCDVVAEEPAGELDASLHEALTADSAEWHLPRFT